MLIIETNVKQRAGPMWAAWESAVARVYSRRVDEMNEKKRQEEEQARLQKEKEEKERLEKEKEERERVLREAEELVRQVQREREREKEREEATPRPGSPIPLPALTSSGGVTVKQEEVESSIHGSGYFFIPPSTKATPFSPFNDSTNLSAPPTPGGIPRSQFKSVPRTPGELPSPRPSPSPPSSPHISRRVPVGMGTQEGFRPFAVSTAQGQSPYVNGHANGYFAKGTAAEEEGEVVVERIRARSVSC